MRYIQIGKRQFDQHKHLSNNKEAEVLDVSAFLMLKVVIGSTYYFGAVFLTI